MLDKLGVKYKRIDSDVTILNKKKESIYLEKSIEILPPPEFPQKTGDKEQWRNFFDALSTELPSDYVEFIETYGSGCIDKFFVDINSICK